MQETGISLELEKWKSSPYRKPLLIHGARQIGKTYSMLAFGKDYYENTVYCNFEDSTALQQIFDSDLNQKRILQALEIMKSTKISPETTLLIFDEIQACEKALTSLKYFCEETPKYHSIAAYQSIHAQLARENAKFQDPVIGSGALAKDYELALAWLKSAGAVLRCTLITEGQYPIHIYENQTVFKIYYSDIGLLSMRMELTHQQNAPLLAIRQHRRSRLYHPMRRFSPSSRNKILRQCQGEKPSDFRQTLFPRLLPEDFFP